MRRIIRRIFNILKWTILAVIALLVVVLILVNLPAVHDYALKKGVAFFNEKTHGQLSVKDITLRLPRYVELKGVELIHPDGQKMVSLEEITIDVTWPALLHQSIMLDHVNITGLKGTVETDENGIWNYQFIIDGFGSDTTSVPDTTSSNWDFGIDHMRLENNQLAYINHQSGDSMVFDIGRLAIEMDDFSVLKNEYVVDEINFENSTGLIQIGESSDEPDTTETSMPHIGLTSAVFSKVDFTYQSPDKTNRYHLNIGAFELEVDELDLKEMRFDIDEVSLSESQIAMYSPAADKTNTESSSDETAMNIFTPLMVKCGELKLDNVGFKMEEEKSEENLQLQNIKLTLEDIAITPDSYALQIKETSVLYNQKIQLASLNGGLSIDKKQAKFEHIQIDAMSSRVELNGNVMYDELSALIEEGKYSQLNLEKLDAVVSPELINPYLPEEYQLTKVQTVHLKTEIKGPYEQTEIDHLDVTIGTTSVNVKADMVGKDWANKTYHIEHFTSDIYKKDISNFLIAAKVDTSSIPSELHLSLEGKYSTDYVAAKGILQTPYGNLNFDAKDENGLEQGQEIAFNATSPKMDVGAFLGMAEPFQLDLDIEAKVDLTDSIPSGTGQIHIDTLEYGKSRIQQLDIIAQMDQNRYTVDLLIQDSSIVGELCAYATIDSVISANLEGNIEGIDFYSLGLTSADLRATFDIDANYFQGNAYQKFDAKFSDILFLRDDDRVNITPIEAGAYLSEDSTNAFVNSEPIQLSSKSNRSVEQITEDIAFLLGGGKVAVMDSTSFLKIDFQISDVPEIREILLPDLTTLDPANGTVDFSAKKGTVTADVSIPKVVYKTYSLEDFRFTALGDSANLSSQLNIGSLSMDTIGVKNIQFTTKTANKKTALQFKIEEDTTTVKYEINASIEADSASLADGFNVHLTQPLVLNEEKWQVDSLNIIRKNSEGIDIENFNFSHNTDSLGIRKSREDHSVVITASSFDLMEISGILYLPDPIVQGELFGELTFHANGSFAGKGYIDDFKLSQAQFGKFEWDAAKKENEFLIDINSNGEDIKLSTVGKIIPQNNEYSQIDFDLNLKEINMAAMPRILPSIFTDGSGVLSGDIKFTGTTLEPVLIGKLSLDGVSIGLKANGETYSIDNETIDIATNKIELNDFTVTDSTGQKLTVNGEITHTYFQDIQANLSIQTDEFTIFNLTEKENHRLYGKFLAGSKIEIKGDINSPSVKANIKVSEKTDVTYVVPEKTYDVGMDKDMIEWVDFQSSIESNVLRSSKNGSNSRITYVQNSLDLTGSLFIDQKAAFKVVVDSAAGDFVEIRGDGKIGVSYDRAGNIRMNGTYKVASGFYKMTFYDIVKRQFDFQEGSSIVWNGSPMDASINFTAIYKTRTSVANLMSSGSSSSATTQSFNEQLPFEVLMIMTGNLEKPQIKFSIDLAKGYKASYGGAVEAKLNELKQNENELNKQVFALLVLNSFISSSPSSNENLAANQARNSASQILSQQLNNLSNEYIKGVDINFDLQSYGGSAGDGNTDLNIDLAKSFMDDRVVVRIGSTIALEDNSTSTEDQQGAMANVSVEYKLTPDGRYRFKVFSETDMDDIAVGRVTRTGVGIMFQRDFDKLNQIFLSNEELRKLDPQKPEAEE